MEQLLEIGRTGVTSVRLHPLRSLVTVSCLVAVLLPYLVGLGLSKGVEQEAEASVRYGADLYVTATQFGRTVPVAVDLARPIRQIDGVETVTPRIVGTVELGKDWEHAVLVGMPPEHFPPSVSCVEGRLPRDGGRNELVVGRQLAERLNLRVGSLLPPFYHNDAGERVSEVVGVFRSDVSLWEADLVFTTFDTAAAIFNQHGLATDLLVCCRPGSQGQVAAQITRESPTPNSAEQHPVDLRVTAREELQALLPAGLLHREGLFNLHFVLAFTVGILVILVTSGFGLAGRRREVAILKATGWQTDEVLLRGLVESVLLGLAGGSVSVLLAYGWLRWLNGWGIAGVFLTGVGAVPAFRVPYRLAPVPALLAVVLALVMVTTGTVYSSWRAAAIPPREGMR